MKIAVVGKGTGYVGFSNGIWLAQHKGLSPRAKLDSREAYECSDFTITTTPTD